jgi:hypothetical protein
MSAERLEEQAILIVTPAERCRDAFRLEDGILDRILLRRTRRLQANRLSDSPILASGQKLCEVGL